MEVKPAKKRRIGRALAFAALLCAMLGGAWFMAARAGLTPGSEGGFTPGEVVDSLDGVYVYYNGSVGNTFGRNTSPDGYNIGLKYQCVEFVKRYYYERYGHKMPDPWGHAKDFFDPGVADGRRSEKRGLVQFTNGSASMPAKGDLLILGPTIYNSYGHVAIVSSVEGGQLEIIQQNPGPRGSSRATFGLGKRGDRWFIDSDRVLGWLRKTE